MSALILHHYDLSPFSEKIRLMLGYAGLPWQSVKVLEVPPRPIIDVLVGGYRKIPVLQIGADIYCDTKAISTEIARRAGKPELALENCGADVQAFVQRADGDVFMASVLTAGLGGLAHLAKETSVLRMLHFVKDRIGIARRAKTKRVTGAQAKLLMRQHLDEMESLLTRAFLFGDQPCIADFSAYHPLHMNFAVKGMRLFEGRPNIAAWFQRMRAFGHGASVEITGDQALDVARDHAPAELGPDALAAPAPVLVAPADYARDQTAGALIAESAMGWVLKREHPRVGTVHLHFPKAGFKSFPA